MNREAFFTALRKRDSGLFGTSLSQKQKAGIEAILDAFDVVGDGCRSTLSYSLATPYHETGRKMEPVREGFAKTDAGARRAVANLAKKRGPKSAVARYAKPAGPYGHVYYGRGYPQLTFHENYVKASAAAGTDLEKNPDAMLDPVVSGRVLLRGLIEGWWNASGKGVKHYEMLDGRPGFTRAEAAEARRTVNVQDNADVIAGYALAFERALDAAGMPIEKPVKPRPAPLLLTTQERPVEARPASRPSRPTPAPTSPPTARKTGAAKGSIAALVAGAGIVLAAKWAEFTAWLTSLWPF